MEVFKHTIIEKTKKDNMSILMTKQKPEELEEIVIMHQVLIEEEEVEEDLINLNKLKKLRKNKHQLNDCIYHQNI